MAALPGLGCRKTEESRGEATIIRTKSGVEMVLIPGGWFRMGSDRGQADERCGHRVWVDSFLMDRYEVTQKLYGKLVPVNSSHFKGAKRPVEMISWADAALYCNKRSRAERLQPCYDEETARCDFRADGYRLPTEAEWEYACRAGTTTKYSFGDDPAGLGDHAWYSRNSAKQTHPVGRKKPNPWRLFDMHGNVAEWCNDIYEAGYYQRRERTNPRGPSEGERYVLRGGGWQSSAGACRSAARVGESPGFDDACFARDAIGFRCVRKAPAKRERAEEGAGR